MIRISNQEQVDLLRHIRTLHAWHHKIAVSVEALVRLARENGHAERLIELESVVSKETAEIHAQTLGLIDERIRQVSRGL